jgi:hypothetical protein
MHTRFGLFTLFSGSWITPRQGKVKNVSETGILTRYGKQFERLVVVQIRSLLENTCMQKPSPCWQNVIGKKWKILVKWLWQQLNIQTNSHRIKYCGIFNYHIEFRTWPNHDFPQNPCCMMLLWSNNPKSRSYTR